MLIYTGASIKNADQYKLDVTWLPFFLLVSHGVCFFCGSFIAPFSPTEILSNVSFNTFLKLSRAVNIEKGRVNYIVVHDATVEI